MSKPKITTPEPQRPSLKDLQKIARVFKSNGFPYVKVELEAHFKRQEAKLTCCGRCPDCRGLGVVLNVDGPATCKTCKTTGVKACGEKHGIEGFISDHEAVNTYFRKLLRNLPLQYSRFYVDGSCDSELTFTLRSSDIHHIPTIIREFSHLGKVTGHCDVRGAGIHIALLQEPIYPSNRKLPRDKVSSFTDNVERLLPALYFLGSGPKTRSLDMRQPRIRRGNSRHEDKYSAVFTKGDTVLEYRIFETCYRNPEMIFDYLAVIANTLTYYDPEALSPVYNHTFEFPEGNSLQRFYQSEKSLKILDKQLELLRPWWKTVDQLKRERGFSSLTSSSLKFRQQRHLTTLREAFEASYQPPQLQGWKLAVHFNTLFNQRGISLSSIEASRYARQPKKAFWRLFLLDNQRQVRHRLEV